MSNRNKILGIETSCDETGVAIADFDGQICQHYLHSQIDIHLPFGGVVPEIASRQHVVRIFELLNLLRKELPDFQQSLAAVAVSTKPGLIGSLLIGTETAKALAYLLKVPLIQVDHLKAHVYGAFLYEKIPFPFLCLIISGGHTIICEVADFDNIRILGQTRDDAVGEAYDKVAKLLDLGYPGGPVIDRIHQEYKGPYIGFTIPMKDDSLDFSFSGLKTAVLKYIQQNSQKPGYSVEQVAASFQETVCQTILYKARIAIKKHPAKVLAVVGGVSANKGIRAILDTKLNVRSIFPPMKFCTDNAAMVAGLGSWYFSHQRNMLRPDSTAFFQVNAEAGSNF